MIRTSAVLRQSRNGWRVIYARKGLISSVVCLTVTTALIATSLTPGRYTSRARLNIPYDHFFCRTTPEQANIEKAAFIKTQLVALKSPERLTKVIQKFHLAETYFQRSQIPQLSTAAALEVLAHHLDLSVDTANHQIAVSVTDSDSALAAAIANEIGNEYLRWKISVREAKERQGLQLLQEELQKIEAGVVNARSNLNQLRIQLRVPSDFEESLDKSEVAH